MTTGILKKMLTEKPLGDEPISYALDLNGVLIGLNALIGKPLTLHFTGKCQCIACGRAIKKTFQQGYCYPCTLKLAQTDLCILKPEICHHHLGTCRDESFAQNHCFIPHSVYLANCGSAKVGLTRTHQKMSRWADQGASQALEIATLPNRREAGFLEVALKEFLSDRTNWRKMLSDKIDPIDLITIRNEVFPKLPAQLQTYRVDSEPAALTYPVLSFPQKIISHDLDKNPTLTGTLMGIKGQYVIFENTVMNLRKYQGYEIDFFYSDFCP